MRYAQIDGNGFVVSDSWLSGEVEADNMIPIAEDFDLTNKKYVDGKWVEYIPEPIEVESALTDEQKAIFETQTNIEYLVCMNEV